jgi:hypothetical protein
MSAGKSIEDLEERIDELETKAAIQDSRIDSLMSHLEKLERAVLGAVESSDAYDREPMEDVLEEVRGIAETAHALAQSETSGSEVNKTEKARQLTRNELVRRAATGAPAWGGITLSVGDVQDMAKPGLEIRYQLVDNAWGDLVETWECFERTTADGNKALKISKKEISRDLARLVEHDLERDDVVQRLFSETDEGG